MKRVFCFLLACFLFAGFVAGCCKNGASADDVEALRKEVAELRAEVRELSRRPQHVRQVREEGAAPERGERRAISRSVAGKEGRDAARRRNHDRVNLTPEQRKARVEELRQRHLERKKASKERRAQRRAARASGEGQGASDAVAPAQGGDAPPADSVQ